METLKERGPQENTFKQGRAAAIFGEMSQENLSFSNDQLRIALLRTSPQVGRRVLVPCDWTLPPSGRRARSGRGLFGSAAGSHWNRVRFATELSLPAAPRNRGVHSGLQDRDPEKQPEQSVGKRVAHREAIHSESGVWPERSCAATLDEPEVSFWNRPTRPAARQVDG